MLCHGSGVWTRPPYPLVLPLPLWGQILCGTRYRLHCVVLAVSGSKSADRNLYFKSKYGFLCDFKQLTLVVSGDLCSLLNWFQWFPNQVSNSDLGLKFRAHHHNCDEGTALLPLNVPPPCDLPPFLVLSIKYYSVHFSCCWCWCC